MDDLISRQAAIYEVKELFRMGDCYCDEYSIIGTLNSLPSAQPEQKTGKWERVSRNLVSCSCCHNCIIIDREAEEFYCHSCGAKMD